MTERKKFHFCYFYRGKIIRDGEGGILVSDTRAEMADIIGILRYFSRRNGRRLALK